MSYQEHADFHRIPELIRLAPTEANAFLAFNASVEREGGHIDRKTRELIALAVAMTTQCPYCIDNHVKYAKEHGASREELAEVAFITGALRAGAGIAHGLLALKLYDTPAP